MRIALSVLGLSFGLFNAAAGAVTFTQTAGGPQAALLTRAMATNSSGHVYSVVSDRIFKSTDSGSTWAPLAGALPAKPASLAIANSTLFIATSLGVHRSADDGATWESFNGSGATSLPDTKGISAVYATATHVFAVTIDPTSTNTLVVRSAAGSASWTPVTPAGIGGDGFGNLVVAGSNLCALVGNSGVRWSANNGDSWTSAGVSGSFAALAVSPSDGNRVYLANFSGGIQRSTNACQSFGSAGFAYSGFTGVVLRGLGADASGQVYASADAGSGTGNGVIRVATDPGSGSMTFASATGGSLAAGTPVTAYSFVPTGGGVLAASTLGAHFRTNGDWQARNSGLVGASVGALVDLGPAGEFMLGHGGGILASLDDGTTYVERNTGLLNRGAGAIARSGNTIVASIFTPGDGTQPPGAYLSTDGGLNWTPLQAASGLAAGKQMEGLVHDGTNFYASLSFGGGVFKSADGATWTASGTGLPASPSIRNFAVKGSSLFAYVGNQGVYRSDDAGANWTAKSSGLNGSKFGKVFAYSGGLIASAGGIVYRSTDNGENWVATTGNAVSRFGIELLSLAEDAAGALYLGDEHAGLSVSKDGGATWTPDSDGLHRSGTCIERINALLFKDGVIYAGQGENGGMMVASPIGGATPGDSVDCTSDIDIWPASFSFTAQNNVTPSAVITSNSFVVSSLAAGYNAPISVQDGEYSVGCNGTFTSLPGTVAAGNSVCVRHTSAATGETATVTRMTIADVKAAFVSRTGLVYSGADDEINTSFGSNGFATSSGAGQADDLEVLADGRILTVGGTQGFDPVNGSGFVVSMYTAAGTLDGTFGTGGKLTVQPTTGSDIMVAALPLASGKFMLVGYSMAGSGLSQVTLVRINANGTLDTGFDGDGILFFDIHPTAVTNRSEIVYDATLLADGSILAVGQITTDSQGSQLFAVKFSQEGVVDTAFGAATQTLFRDGVAHSGSLSVTASDSLAVQSTGKFVIGARTNASTAIAVRFNADGAALDSGWGTAGVRTVPGTLLLRDAITLAADKILFFGQSTSPFRALLARLNADGTMDTSFSGDGVALLDAVTNGVLTTGEVLPDGDYVGVGAGTAPDGSSQLLYARFNPDGTLDTGTGPGGQGYVFRGPVNGSTVTGTASALRGDGGLVVGGVFGSNQGVFVFGGDEGAPAPDTTPEPFTFSDQSGVATSSTITSAPVTITGINQAAGVTVSGGSYSVGCTGSFTTSGGTVGNGQQICVQHTSSASNSTATNTVLTVGGVSDTFTSTTAGPPDTTPETFSFTDVTGVEPLATVTSGSITVIGVNQPTAVSVSGGSYSLGCTATYVTEAGSATNGQMICVRHVAAAGFGANTDTLLTVGGVSDTFRSTTRAADTTPATFTFTDQTDVALSTAITSAPVTISGIEASVAISVTGGTYSVGCTATYTASAGTVTNGQQVCVRHTSSASHGTATDTVLTAGGVSDTFTSTTFTPGPDTTPDAFSFIDADGVEPESTVESGAITVAGIDTPASIGISGGEFRIGTGSWGSGSTTVTNGQTVQVRLTAPAFGASASVTLTIGGVSDTFTVTSREANEDSVETPTGEAAGVVADAGTLEALENDAVPPAAAPAGFDYPYGFFSFELTGLTAGDTVTVVITLPDGPAPDAYVKCDDAGTTCTQFGGAVIAGNVITLTLTDGGPGDADGLANGTIVDPGAPAVAPSSAPADDDGFLGIGGFGPGMLLALAGLAGLRRRRGR